MRPVFGVLVEYIPAKMVGKEVTTGEFFSIHFPMQKSLTNGLLSKMPIKQPGGNWTNYANCFSFYKINSVNLSGTI